MTEHTPFALSKSASKLAHSEAKGLKTKVRERIRWSIQIFHNGTRLMVRWVDTDGVEHEAAEVL